MSSEKKITYSVIIIIWSLICFGAGIVKQDLPFVRFNSEIKIYEVLNIFITISIGVSIPFLVKKLIDDYRPIKNMIVDDIKDILLSLKEINTIISNCHQNNKIDQSDKDRINYIFHKSELQIESLKEQIDISYKNQSDRIVREIKDRHNKYKDYLTGGELMLSTFQTIDVRFFRENSTEFAKIERYLKTLIHKIHKL